MMGLAFDFVYEIEQILSTACGYESADISAFRASEP
jgi:hypothetical protein